MSEEQVSYGLDRDSFQEIVVSQEYRQDNNKDVVHGYIH